MRNLFFFLFLDRIKNDMKFRRIERCDCFFSVTDTEKSIVINFYVGLIFPLNDYKIIVNRTSLSKCDLTMEQKLIEK